MKKTFLFRALFLLSIISLVVFSCDDNGISEDQAILDYNRKDQLTNLFKNGIAPLHQEFLNQTYVFNESAEIFKSNYTLENFNSLQDSFKQIMLLWKRCEVYNIGDINDSFIHTRIQTWPVNVENIESIIEENNIINLDLINSVGSSSKGISSIEYLLFDSFENLISNSKRIDYLTSLSENLINDAFHLDELWTEYGPNFINAVQSDLDGGQNQTVNAMVTLIENIIINKLGKALGDNNGGNTTIDELEAFRSDFSLDMIEENIEELHLTFSGDFILESRKIGFDNYLSNLENESLISAINSSFIQIKEHINSFNASLNNTLQNDPEKVLELQNYCSELLVLIKVDLASFIGSTITFNENDGD